MVPIKFVPGVVPALPAKFHPAEFPAGPCGPAGPIAPFIEARGFHEFRDENNYLLTSGTSTSTLDGNANGKGSWVRLEAGIGGGNNGGPLLSAWANVGDTTGYGVRAGFRF